MHNFIRADDTLIEYLQHKDKDKDTGKDASSSDSNISDSDSDIDSIGVGVTSSSDNNGSSKSFGALEKVFDALQSDLKNLQVRHHYDL